jgi:hypothetical protein
MLIHAVGRSDLPPLKMPERFRTDVAYFMTPAGRHGVPKLPSGEYWIRLDDATTWLDEGVVAVVSPLDSANTIEFEVTDEQETWLRWMVSNQVEHVRLA